ncbi:MAG: FtsX-like permease family protein [Planctomycetes bacterium]|nr:FtsX-like permease family protein [Planctomycetota bacterium]
MLLKALFLRPARAHPLRFLATWLGVAAGVAALVSTRVSSRAAVDAFAEGVLELAGPARLEVVQDGGVPNSVLAALAPVVGDAELLPVVDEVVLCPKTKDTLRVLGVDALSPAVAQRLALDLAAEDADPARDEGGETGAARSADALQRGLRCEGVWIASALARELDVAPGGTLEVVVRGRAAPLVVLGLFAPRDGSRTFERVLLLDVACAQELFGHPATLDRIELVPKDGVGADELRARVALLLPAGARLQEPEQRAEDARSLARTLQFDLDVMALISLVVGGVLVAISLATSVVQRREVLAICVSLGASRGQLARALVAEALVLGVAGGLLGSLFGAGAAAFAAQGVRATLATVIGQAPARAVELRAGDVVFATVLGAACALAAALLPVHEARRTPPVQNLRRERPTELGSRARAFSIAAVVVLVTFAAFASRLEPWNGLPIAALTAAFALQATLFFALPPLFELVGHVGSRASAHTRAGMLLRLALSAIASGRRRAVWAAGAVGIAVSLSIAITTMIDSFRATLESWTVRALTADFWIRPASSALGGPVGRLDPEYTELALSLYGPGAVDPFHSARARVEGEETELCGAQFEVVKQRGIMVFQGGIDAREAFARAHAEHGVTVNEAFALRFDKTAGDVVRIEVGGRALEKRIVGVFQDFGGSQGQVFVDGEEFRALLPGDGPREIAIFLPPGTDVDAARARFVAALGPEQRVELVSVRELRERVFEVFERTFAVTRGIELVAAAVAVIAVLTVLFALLAERRTELGILRALGASPAQVGVAIGLQAGLLGGVGAFSGCVAGVAIGWLTVVVVHLQSFRWTLDFHVPWGALVETLLVVTIVCALAGLWPALVSSRWSPRELLREED